MEVKKLNSSEGNVFKYIFEFTNAIAESVLYKYDTFDNRTVICCSVQSGCPVGCTFCGTGNKFIKNLTANEIVAQIKYVLKDNGIENLDDTCSKFQIMFMSMGEPFLNYNEVEYAIMELNHMYPNAQLLVSTVGVKKPEVSEEEELVNDLMMLMASFSGKLYGRRSAKRRKEKNKDK